jgi:serine/threonine protein phosphatase PrpC
MNVKTGIEVASLTNVGRQRENNEDAYLYWEPSRDDELARKGCLAIVADGMGGYEGGHEASQLAVDTVREVYERAFHTDPQTTLLEAFALAHERIRKYAEGHPGFQGMGTTCTAVVLRGRRLYFAHIGDSRLYLVDGSQISRLTRDHSYVSRLVENGIVRSEDAEKHPQRHILTAALGAGTDILADTAEHQIDLQDGDTLILCTDGLWGVVSEEEIVNAVKENAPADSCSTLVNSALQRGGPDNITVQVLRVTSTSRN